MNAIPPRNLNYFNEQYWYAGHVLECFLNISEATGLSICEVGTAEGGTLQYFGEKGHRCYGIEFAAHRNEIANLLNQHSNIRFVNGDITNPATYRDKIPGEMDIVICRDVIEHIEPEKKLVALQNMVAMLKSRGKLFISFPPKYSAYAGHQQGSPALLGKLPYLHCLPDNLYAWYLALLKIPRKRIDNFLNVKACRLSIRQFEQMTSQLPVTVHQRQFYIVRPAHEYRFNIRRIRQPLNSLFINEWFSTGALYCLIKN